MGGMLSSACSPEGRSDQYTVYKEEQTIIDALHAGADLQTLQRILAKGGAIDHGGPILHQAMSNGSIASALLMLRLGRLVLHPRDSYLLIVALQLPTSLMQLELLHLLLVQGCLRGFNVNYIHHGQDGDDDTDTVFTPLSYALAHGQPDAALLLLHFGADPTVSLGSLYQGLYTPFSEWCRRVLLAPAPDSAAGRHGHGHPQRRASSPRDIQTWRADEPQVSVWGTPLDQEDPPPSPPALFAQPGSSGSDVAPPGSSLDSASPLDVRQQQLLFASARHQPSARRGAAQRKAPVGTDAGGSGGSSGPQRTLKRTYSASSEREETKAQLRRFQRESSLQGLAARGRDAVPPGYLRRSAIMRRRLNTGHPMCTGKLARALIRAGCDPNECVGASGVFKLVGVPALQHTLAWPDVVFELLKGGAHPEGHPQFAVTPLLQACDSCNVPWQTVYHLLAAGANPSLACKVATEGAEQSSPPRGGGRALDLHQRRRSVSTHEPAPRVDVSAFSEAAGGGGAPTRRRSASAPGSPRGARKHKAPPPAMDLHLFMTPFEALCGRIVEEVGGDGSDSECDLPPGALLPPDTEAIARLLPAWGADANDVRKQLALLRHEVPRAARAAHREALWGLRSRVVCFRDAFRATNCMDEPGLQSTAGSVRSAPPGAFCPEQPVELPPGANALPAVTSRSLLLLQTHAMQPEAGLGEQDSAQMHIPLSSAKPRTYSYGRMPRPHVKCTQLTPAPKATSPAPCSPPQAGSRQAAPASGYTRRASFADVGHSVSARSIRTQSLNRGPVKRTQAPGATHKRPTPVHAWL